MPKFVINNIINFICLTCCILVLKGGAIFATEFQSERGFSYTNDFSQRIYLDGASYNRTGPYPKAAKIIDGILEITVTPKMLDKHSKRTGRFEIEKANIEKHLAVYQSFRFKSVENKITDRVLISQIKYRKRRSRGISPIASVYLDRPPTCNTWMRNEDLEKYRKHYDFSIEHGLYFQNFWWYKEDFGNKTQFSWRATRHVNSEWGNLNDGNWHTVEMDVYPHEVNGYCIIKIDGKLWNAIIGGPTKSYFMGKHGSYDARIGIYRDAVDYNHTINFDDWSVKAYQPEGGPIIPLN